MKIENMVGLSILFIFLTILVFLIYREAMRFNKKNQTQYKYKSYKETIKNFKNEKNFNENYVATNEAFYFRPLIHSKEKNWFKKEQIAINFERLAAVFMFDDQWLKQIKQISFNNKGVNKEMVKRMQTKRGTYCSLSWSEWFETVKNDKIKASGLKQVIPCYHLGFLMQKIKHKKTKTEISYEFIFIPIPITMLEDGRMDKLQKRIPKQIQYIKTN